MIRVKEAFERAKELGLVTKKTCLAREIWKGSEPKSAYTNLHNLESGKSRKIDIDAVVYLAKRLGVSADYLFGLTDSPNPDEYRKGVNEKAKEIIGIAETL